MDFYFGRRVRGRLKGVGFGDVGHEGIGQGALDDSSPLQENGKKADEVKDNRAISRRLGKG